VGRDRLRSLAAALFIGALALAAGACGGTSKSTTTLDDPSAGLGVSTTVADTPEARAVAARGEPTVSAVPVPNAELIVTDDVVGTGAEVKPGDTLSLQYVGAVAETGKAFDSTWSSGGPVPVRLTQVIPGWSEGLVGMKVGGRRTLVIPAAKAYGANPPPGAGIPADADLVFVVDLVSLD